MLLKLANDLRTAILDEAPNLIWNQGHPGLAEAIITTALHFPETPDDFKVPKVVPVEYEKVILFSGGMDSRIAWHLNKACDSKVAVHVDFGSDYAVEELTSVSRSGVSPFIYEKLNYSYPDQQWEHIIPGRNLMLLGIAAEHVKNDGEIWIGVVQGESSTSQGDKSRLFFHLVSQFIWRTMRKKVRIETLEEKTKNDWLKWYLEDIDNDLSILKTFTCFTPNFDTSATDSYVGCGHCQACVRKWIAMRYCGLDTKPYFHTNPYYGGNGHIVKYKKAMSECLAINDYTHYSEDRCRQDLHVIKEYESEANKVNYGA